MTDKSKRTLTPEQKEELAHVFEAMTEEDREIAIRVAQYLAVNKPSGMTMEKMAELWERFRTPPN